MKLLPNGIAVLENDQLSAWVEEHGRLDHDRTVEEHILPLIKHGDIVVDGGAALGDHTVRYASKAQLVLAFEPHLLFFECLKHNTAHLQNVSCINMALSDRSGETSIHMEFGNHGASYLQPGYGTETMTIDSMDQRVDFLKLDIEGFEFMALNGARQTIKMWAPTILLEMNQKAMERLGLSYSQMFDLLNELGYRYSPLGRDIHDPWSEQYDLLCVPK